MVHNGLITVGSTVLGTDMVDDRVNDDLQTELMRLVAHGDELGLDAQSVVGAVVELEAYRLIEHPPSVGFALSHVDVLCRQLDLIRGRNLNGRKALLGDFFQVRFNVREGPVPRLQSKTVVNGLGQTVLVRGGGLRLHIGICRAGRSSVNVSAESGNSADHGNARHDDEYRKQYA